LNSIAKSIFLLMLTSTTLFSRQIIPPGNPDIQYIGRIDRTHADRVMFDWPAVSIQAVFNGTGCSVILGGINRYDIYIDGIVVKTVQTVQERTEYPIAQGLSDRPHRLLVVKRSESAQSTASFFGLILDDGKALSSPPPLPQRKIEFIGDSYTAGFACEYLNQACPAGKEDSTILASTNGWRAFGPLTARAFGAQAHVIAISGKGLVRNYNGIDKGKELLAFYDYALIASGYGSGERPTWDFSTWKADVAVIGIGINDFQADPPYADSARFDAVYSAFIGRLRKQYPGVTIICCATRVWPTDLLIPHVKAIVDRENRSGRNDVSYFEYHTENGALYGHPSIHDHQAIADSLIPVIAKATGWRRTDQVRGK
jgi:hypothetical protein